MNKKQSAIRIESWGTDSDLCGRSRWKTTVVFVPKGTQIVKSRFSEAQYDKLHKEPLGYECDYVIEMIS